MLQIEAKEYSSGIVVHPVQTHNRISSEENLTDTATEKWGVPVRCVGMEGLVFYCIPPMATDVYMWR